MATARIDIEVVDRKNAQRRLAQITQAEQRLNVQFKGGVITSEQLRRSTERLARAKALLTRRLNTNSASLRRANRAAATMTTTLGSLRSVAAAVGVTFGLWQVTRIFGSATRAAIDFEAEFANVSTLINTETPKGVKQLKLLEQQILALDSRLGGATELTRGLYQALSAGAEPAQAVRLVGEAALFAKAALTDTFTAVDVLTTVLNAYRENAGTAAQASSALFTIIAEGKILGTQLARSLGLAIAPAAELGVLLPDLGAALAAITKGGTPFSVAVTGMVQILKAFQKPTATAKKLLEEMGLSADELRVILRERGLGGALTFLKERTETANLKLADFFESVEAFNLVLILTGAGADDFAASLAKLKQAQEEGTATMVAAEKQFDTTKSKVSELEAELEKLKIALNFDQVAESFAISLTKITRAVTSVIKTDEVQLALRAIGNMLSGPNGIFRGLGDTSKALDDVETPIKKVRKAVDDLAGDGGGGLGKLTEEEKKARKALEEFQDSLSGRALRGLFAFNDALDATREGLEGLKGEMDLGPAAEKLDLSKSPIANLERDLAILRAQLAGDTVAAILLQEDKRLQETLANLETLGASEENLARAREILHQQTAVKIVQENQRAFEQMAQQIDFFFQRAALGAKSFGDFFKQIWTQLLSFFISQVSRMVAAWVLGQRTMQAASAGGGGGGIGSILGGILGGGSIFGSATAPGGTGTFSGAPIGSNLVSGGGGLASFADFGVPGIGVPTGLPPAPAGSSSGIAAQSGILGALGLNPLALLASAGIAGGLLGRGGNLLLGGLGGFGLGLGATVGIGALLGAPLGIGLAAGVIPGLVIGAIGLITAIFSRGKNKRKAAASEEVLTQQLGEVINEFKSFQTDLEGTLATIDQLFEAFQGQVKPLGKAGRNAVKNISPLVFAVKSRLTEIQATRDARLLLSAGSLIPEFHSGGLVPSLLQPGEFVVQRSAVQQVGVQNLERINRGEAPAGNVNINITINPSPGMDERAVGEMAARAIRRSFRNRGLQFGA